MTSFEATNSVCNRTNRNISFSITTPGYWSYRECAETIHKLQKKILELRSQNDIELHVEEVRKRANQIKTSDKEYKLSELDTQKKRDK